MARTVRDTSLESRAARLRLSPRSKPYWRSLETGLHVGYRRLRQGGGTWVVRRFCESGRYSERQLGVADDLQDGDGVIVLSFRDAQDAARRWWKEQQRRELGIDATGRPYTVERAVRDYLEDYVRRGGRDVLNQESMARVHIVPALGAIEASRLTTKQIREWHDRLAASQRLAPGRRSSDAPEKQSARAAPDPEDIRRRRSRANRVLSVLKATLNHAFAERQIASDEAWRRVQPFRNVDTPRIRYLAALECQRLVNACEPGFRDLVKAAMMTGARYGELTRLTAADVDLQAATIHVRESKSGKPRHIPLTDDARELFEALVVGRSGSALVFVRADGRTWKRSEQARPLASACERAKIDPPITFHGLRDTFATLMATSGAPMAVIAQVLGHADTRITEKHYAHLAPNYVSATVRAHFPRLFGPANAEAPKLLAIRAK
jgi:integrase